MEYEEFVPFTLKLNINKNTFNIPKNVPEIKEITLEKYGPVKEIYQEDLKFLVAKDIKDEVMIYNSKANENIYLLKNYKNVLREMHLMKLII